MASSGGQTGRSGKSRASRLRAMAEAYNEAAAHLEMDWTFDPIEREAGRALARHFWRQWERLANMADDLDHSGSAGGRPT